MKNNWRLFTILIFFSFSNIQLLVAQQINITRIEQMPNTPFPYKIRDWKLVARGYDSLVFDLNRTGQFLPLAWLNSNTTNYPNHDGFGLPSYVGINPPSGAEAINLLPAVIGASLVGIDKSNQNSNDWVLMCEEFFNRRPEENVYLNNTVASSGSDWWYDTMPNLFFYQLYNLYPKAGDFAYQFTTVADRWLEAVSVMGGSTTPWKKPSMNYRAWKLSPMTPLESGVKEPEAAGAIAWILYNAFIQTGERKYRIGAEWCLEFLNGLSKNPSYELQLPYGVYTAARMNAELGTNYNIEKMLNWCFEPDDNVRGWGATLGRWGDYDCYGLIGEAQSRGYAFIMNGFEMAGALAPMVRYDDRFARAIGKWILNLANASRLFYANFLPDDNQDSENWSHTYDPNSYIAYEALKEWEYNQTNTIRPFATGDAMRSGWAQTNLALYGSSHVGIFGGIIDTTNVKMILKLNTRKTDYFQKDTFSTYLYFNPYGEEKNLQIDVGTGVYDLYDAVSNQFLKTNVSGIADFKIPANQAVLPVLLPSGANIEYDLDKMLVNGVVADYSSGQPVQNYLPRIKSLTALKSLILCGENVAIYCTAFDRENNPLTYNWNASDGAFIGNGSPVIWTAPDSAGTFNLFCSVDDGNGGVARDSLVIAVIDNQKPQILSLTATPKQIDPAGSVSLFCNVKDPDGDTLYFSWSSESGILSGTGATVYWTAPQNPGYYKIYCTVYDDYSCGVTDSIGVSVGKLVVYFPFNGNANDESGFANHGSVLGASLTADRLGNTNSAFYFDGSNDFIKVNNHPSLNFQDGITVAFDMKINKFFSREAYPLSHGNWENRWKLSITGKGMRWTVKTTAGIKDLDSKTKFVTHHFYYIAARFDGSKFDIFIDGKPDASSNWSGKILPTSLDLTIGQVLPNNPNYNFNGVLDDVRIYNTALTDLEIFDLYSIVTSTQADERNHLPEQNNLAQNFPNPFNQSTNIIYHLKKSGKVHLVIYDMLGKQLIRLVDQQQSPGIYAIEWNGENQFGSPVPSGIYFYEITADEFSQRKKLILMK